MPECEIYRDKKAIEVTGRAMQQSGYVFCTIKRGQCPYNSEGHRIINQGREGVICKTHGQVDKQKMFDDKAIRKLVRSTMLEVITQPDDLPNL